MTRADGTPARAPNVLLVAFKAIAFWALVAVALAFVLGYMGGFHPSPLAYALPVLPTLWLARWLWRRRRRLRRNHLHDRFLVLPSLQWGAWLIVPALCALLYLMLLYPVLGRIADAAGTAHWRTGQVVVWDPNHHYGRRSRTECTLVRARFIDGAGRAQIMSQCLQHRDPATIAGGTALRLVSRESLLGVVTPGVVEVAERTPRTAGAR